MSQTKAPYIIAEIGFNHGGNIDLAKEMIQAAADSGAEAAKIQTYLADELALLSATHYELVKAGELDLDAHRDLFDFAKSIGITLFSTPFGPASVDLLEAVDTPIYKIASMDLNNSPFIEYIAKKKKPILLSTGMSNLFEIQKSVQLIQEHSQANLALLHCVSHYPTKSEDAFLKAIPILKNNFDLRIGFSDHTLGIECSIAAIALGARIIEKHFTLDKTMKGPDHAISADPAEMKRLVNAAKDIYTSIQPETDLSNRPDLKEAGLFRRSIHTAKDIPQGTTIEESMLKAIRPGSGLPPCAVESMIGKTAARDIPSDTLLTSSDLN